jgi:lipopolysaccharide export system protein LptA
MWCALGSCVLGLMLRAELSADNAAAKVVSDEPIAITADYATEGKTEDGQRILILRGRCRLQQGQTLMTARQMVVWQSSSFGTEKLALYLEDDVHVEQVGQSDQEPNAFVQLSTRAGGVASQFRFSSPSSKIDEDALYQRGIARRRDAQRASLTQTQFVVPSQESTPPSLRAPAARDGMRRIRVSPRTSTNFQFGTEKSESTVPPEQITILTGGVNLVMEGDDQFDIIDLSADRVVIWTDASDSGQFNFETVQSKDAKCQVYLEGNIVARQGVSVVRAERAYYDAREDRGLLIDAELAFKPPELKGQRIRVRAERLRQNARNEFHASNAWTSSSQFGRPGFRIQSSDIFVEPYFAEPLDLPRLGSGFDSQRFDPVTGAPIYREIPYITALNNALLVDTPFVNDVPLGYAPFIAGPADIPNIPIKRAEFDSDRVFGLQFRTSWDLFALLGAERPVGTTLNLDANYFSRRGPSVGFSGGYTVNDLFGWPGTSFGEGIANYIHDGSQDNLGLDRRSLDVPENNRGRLTWRHRQELPDGFLLRGELGYLGDRNYLEQYYEGEFDTGKDIETLLGLQQQIDNWQWDVLVRPQLFGFENNTQWLPRGDFTFLGEPLLGGWLSWSSHSMAGYANLHQADPPNITGDLFSPLPYYVDRNGGLTMTRHELSAPLDFGSFNLVPYVWGEAAGWSNSFSGDSISRLVGSVGVRGSIQFAKYMPWVQNRILGLNGLAHKMVFDVDWSLTESNRALSLIPQWNEFDDNSQERFRQRLLFNTFGGTLPPQFDPRSFAVRSGAGSSVTAPWHELVDDLHVIRLGWRHRLQTKVGPLDRLRTKDWMTLDLEMSLFPDRNRDNFGETAGLLGGRYAWHVGERTSLLANAYYDVFSGGMQLWNIGVLNQRGTRGSLYAGVRQVKGFGFESQILTASASYAMSEKWIGTTGTAYDLAEGRNRGQSFTLTRVGADFIFHFGANFDASKNNAGLAISVEPRFGAFNSQSTQLSNLLGIQ